MANAALMGDVLDTDLGGYKIVNAEFIEVDHDLMGCFPAIFSQSREPVIFVDEELRKDVQKFLSYRKSKARSILFLLEPGGRSGFMLIGENPRMMERCQVLTRQEFDAHSVGIEWAPGIL